MALVTLRRVQEIGEMSSPAEASDESSVTSYSSSSDSKSTETAGTDTNPFNFTDGDIVIKVCHEDIFIEGKVSAFWMSQASPRWCVRVQSALEVSQRVILEPVPPTLNFYDENSHALLMLLKIAHQEFDATTWVEMKGELLYQVAILCELNECVGLVKPYLGKWFGNLMRRSDEVSKSRLTPMSQEKWLYISYVFGRIDVFEALCWKFVKKMKMERSELGEPNKFHMHGNQITTECLPKGLPGKPSPVCSSLIMICTTAYLIFIF